MAMGVPTVTLALLAGAVKFTVMGLVTVMLMKLLVAVPLRLSVALAVMV
ncbi:hypothetical protein UNDKW_4451 [Undibacterium sp. KW1]|nr:hypothetical protein UNDKW_4451 [Undibacterium sp. KW1]